MDDWYRVIWTDEATFETGLDTRSCYVTRKPGTAMESRYLKPTFKSGRSTIGIWGAITLGLKGPVLFLQKEGQMNSEIYINQVLRELGLPFYERCMRERGDVIWMDDGAGYAVERLEFMQYKYKHEEKIIQMRFSGNLSENRFYYLKKPDVIITHIRSFTHTEKMISVIQTWLLSDISSVDHRSRCGFLSIPIR